MYLCKQFCNKIFQNKMDNVENPENFEPDYGKYCLSSKGSNP